MKKIKYDSLDGKKKKDKLKELKKKHDDKIKAYKDAQKFQLENGGPGPVADYDTMAIVNEFAGKYEIELPDDAPEPTPPQNEGQGL